LEIFTDSTTETDNGIITSGGGAVLRGSLLKFDPKNDGEGIFFVAADNPAEEIRATVYQTIRSNEVSFTIPAIEPKDYVLTVKSTYYGWASVRKGEMENLLTVEP